MRKTYVGVELEIVSFSTQDVVRTSGFVVGTGESFLKDSFQEVTVR